MDLVDEEHVVRLQLGQEAAERALVLDGGPRRGVGHDTHLACDDVRQRRLAEARRAAEKNVVEGLASAAGCFDEHAQVVFVVLLPDVLVERGRPKKPVEAGVVRLLAAPENALFLWGEALGAD